MIKYKYKQSIIIVSIHIVFTVFRWHWPIIIRSVGWQTNKQTNVAPVSERALVSSDMSGMSLFVSPYWLHKCFIIQSIQIYIMKGLFTKKVILEYLKHRSLQYDGITIKERHSLWCLYKAIKQFMRHNAKQIVSSDWIP